MSNAEKIVFGICASPGQICGTAIRLENGRKCLSSIDSNSIIVTNKTSLQALAPYVLKCGGLVLGGGGLLSHIVILARQKNIPVIINARGATKLVQDDDNICIDANSGRVIVFTSITQGKYQ